MAEADCYSSDAGAGERRAEDGQRGGAVRNLQCGGVGFYG